MHLRLVITAYIFSGLLAVEALAMTETLTWQQCVAEASQNNGELRASLASTKGAGEARDESRAAYYPQVSTSLGYNYGDNLEAGQSLFKGSETRGTGSYNAALTISQNLFSGRADQARVESAAAVFDASEAEVQASRARVSHDLKEAFAGLMYAQRSIELEDNITQRREDNLRLVTLRYESGSENKGSVLLSQAYLDQARLEALRAKHSLELSRARLAQVLGRDQISPVKVTGEIPVSVPLGTPDFAGLAQQTPNHRQSRAELAQSTAAVTLARASFFPTLSMSGNLGRQGEGWFPQAERWSLGLELSYPLFSGGRDRAAAYAAASRRLASEAKSQQADRAQVSQLQESYFAWLEAIERVKVEMSFYQAAKLRSEIARNKYNNGLLSFEDWDVIESDLISRQRENLLSLRNRVVAEAAWEQAQGKGVIH